MTRQKVIESVYILNFIMEDLSIGMQSVANIKPSYSEAAQMGLQRMSLSHIFLTLSKYLEFYEHYSLYLPKSCQKECKKLYNNISNRKILGFRNSVVGHIWDKRKKKPLFKKDTNEYYSKIIDGSGVQFLLWINDPENNVYPNTVVSIILYTRDCLIKAHSITEEEVFEQ